MSKRNKIIYWIATIWLALGMTSTGGAQLFRMDEEVVKMKALGYQPYFLTLLGVWKILGVIVVLLPKTPLLKEWAYAGFFFAMSGAILSHIAMSDPPIELFGPVLLLILTCTSWAFRPADRRLVPARA